jgi:HK97 family phage major capsid protein
MKGLTVLNSKEVRSKISSLLMEQQQIAIKGFTAESRAKFDRIQADVAQLEADAERLQAMEARDAELRSFNRSPRPGVNDSQNEQRTRVNAAFRSYALTGRIDHEYRDLLTTSDSTGGALIPQMFSGILVDARKFYGPIADKVMQKVTDNKGVPMKVSYDNDTVNGLTLLGTEGTSSPAETDPAFESQISGVDTVTGGLVKVSFQELEDSSFDLDQFIRSKFSIRYARGLERAITLGVDSASTTLPNQPSGGLLASAHVGQTTSSLVAGIGWDDLTALFSSVDPAYSIPGKASWVMNSTTRATLLAMKDGFGRPFWTPDPSADGPFGRLLGYDVILNQSLANIGASAKPILFGDLEAAFMLRTDGQPSILRLNERYADTLEVGFYLWSRIGGLYLGQSSVYPVVALQIASS